MVIAGSTMTLSPDFVVPMNSFVFLYCSATRGEILALKPPVPRPIMILPTMKMLKQASGLLMMPGIAVMMTRIWPTKAMAIETQMVLYLPQCASAT